MHGTQIKELGNLNEAKEAELPEAEKNGSGHCIDTACQSVPKLTLGGFGNAQITKMGLF